MEGGIALKAVEFIAADGIYPAAAQVEVESRWLVWSSLRPIQVWYAAALVACGGILCGLVCRRRSWIAATRSALLAGADLFAGAAGSATGVSGADVSGAWQAPSASNESSR